jgi:hypothetical protein
LRHTWAVAELGEAERPWQLLVRVEAPGVDPDARNALDGWEATPHQRFERLLRDTGVFAGLLISEREERAEGEVRYYPEFRLIYAPRGETSRHQSIPIRPMAMVAPLLGRGALGVPGLLDGKGRHSIGLRWFAASELTLARPKAPQIARRALSMSPGEQVRRLTHMAMRPLRQKSSRIRRPQRVRDVSVKEVSAAE